MLTIDGAGCCCVMIGRNNQRNTHSDYNLQNKEMRSFARNAHATRDDW